MASFPINLATAPDWKLVPVIVKVTLPPAELSTSKGDTTVTVGGLSIILNSVPV